MPPTPAPDRTAAPGQQRGLALDLSGLILRGQEGRVLLDVARLAVAAGQTIAVTGPSGAGKSTLLHALAGLLRPDAGTIVWGGTDLARLDDRGRTAFRRQSVGLVFQDFLLFDELGPLDNAALAAAFTRRSDRAALRGRAAGWLERLGLAAAAPRHTALLSGGERQRVAMARALANAPSVILADEPTASLDRANAERLADDLIATARAEGATLVVVTHDPGLAARMDRRIVMADGRITEDSHA